MDCVDKWAALRCVTVRVTVVFSCISAWFAFMYWFIVTVVTVSVTVRDSECLG